MRCFLDAQSYQKSQNMSTILWKHIPDIRLSYFKTTKSY